MRACVVSGSFDPITHGHMDIINRSKEIFDTVYVVMLINPEKSYLFTREERMKILERALDGIAIADFYDGYTVDYCKAKGIKHIVRGIRNVEAYAYENKINMINREINSEISTIFLPANPIYQDISSTMIRNMLIKGEDISSFVPESTIDLIGEYYGKH